jgi:NADH:ubiquinone oxidoreductase subunit K
VQTVIRPYNDEFHDYRGYAGRIAGGVWKKGDKVTVLPSGFSTTVAKIETFDGELEEAYPPMSVTLLLEDDIDISRGDMIVRENNQPEVTQDVEVMLCWFNERLLISLSIQRQHILIILLILEAIILTLALMILLHYPSEIYSLIILISIGACEARLGLRCLVSITRSYGNDYISSLNKNIC